MAKKVTQVEICKNGYMIKAQELRRQAVKLITQAEVYEDAYNDLEHALMKDKPEEPDEPAIVTDNFGAK
jgi:hypothetical protein